MTWKQLAELLKECSAEQLNKKVVALIDGEPWEPECFQIAPEDDPEWPNNPYLLFS